MKKTIALFLIFIFISNTFGNVCFYQLLKEIHKSKMYSEIESGEFKHKHKEIVVGENDFNSGKIIRVEEREIKYSGKMYDIVSEHFDGSKYHFICVMDEDEDELNNAYNKNENKKNKDGLKNLLKIFLPFAVLLENNITIPNLLPEDYSCRMIFAGSNNSPVVLTPPPNMFLD